MVSITGLLPISATECIDDLCYGIDVIIVDLLTLSWPANFFVIM